MDTIRVAKISKALAAPPWLQIYQAIAAHPDMCCGEIIEKHGLTPGTMSHPLRVLAEAGLIECRREGQFIRNCALRGTMQEYTQTLARMARPAKHHRERP